MEKYFLIGALAIATVGAIKDVAGRRIPNWLTYSGILAGLAIRSLAGWTGVKDGLWGLLVGGGILYVLFIVGAMGGGDVKLMAAVGAWAGSVQAMYVLVITAMAGGILALGYILYRGRVRLALLNTVELIRHHLTSGFRPHPVLNVREPESLRIPYGLAIAIGTVYCVGTMFWRG